MLSIRKTLALGLGVAVLAVGFVAAAPIIGAKAEPGSGNWLVDNAEAVTVVNFKALFGSNLMKKGGYTDKMIKAMEKDEKAKAVLEATGLDVTKDLDSLVMSVSSVSNKAKAKGRVVLKGKFDVAKLTAAMKKADNVTTSTSGTVTVFEIKAQDQTLYGAFSGKNVFIITQDKDETVDLAKNGASKAPKENKEMAAALKKFTGKEALAMAVVITDELKKMAAAQPQLKPVQSLTTVTIAATVADNVNLAIVGNTTDGKAAAKIAKDLTGLHAAGGLFIGMNDQVPPLAKELYEAIKVDNTRDMVSIKLEITKEQIAKAETLGKK